MQNYPNEKKLNAAAKTFATQAGTQGIKGFGMIVERLEAARITGNIQPILYMAEMLGGSDGAKVMAIAKWAFEGAMVSHKSRKTGDISITFSKRDQAAVVEITDSRMVALQTLVHFGKTSFRSDDVAELIAKEGKPRVKSVFDRDVAMAAMLKKLNDNDEAALAWANDFVRYINAIRAQEPKAA